AAGLEFRDGVAELSHANLQDGVMAVLELAQSGNDYRVDVTVLQRRRTGSIFLLAKRAGLETLRRPVRVDTAMGPFELVVVSSHGTYASSSASSSAVGSPSSGGGRRTLAGVAENLIGMPTRRSPPTVGCSTVSIIPRAFTCSLSSTSGTVRTGPTGTSAAA